MVVEFVVLLESSVVAMVRVAPLVRYVVRVVGAVILRPSVVIMVTVARPWTVKNVEMENVKSVQMLLLVWGVMGPGSAIGTIVLILVKNVMLPETVKWSLRVVMMYVPHRICVPHG